MSNVEIIQHSPREIEQSRALVTPMDMLNHAVMSNADISVLEKLMGLQERWEASQARKAFDNAIAEAKANIKPISANSTGHNNAKFADFAAIAREVDPILSQHGLSYRFRTSQVDGKISVTCVLSHRDGHFEETTLVGPADTSGSKNAIQSIGSTCTYLQRYSLVQMLGLATSKDDDGNAAGKGEPLSDEQVKKIREALRFIEGNEQKFCQFKKVERLEDIPAKEFDACMTAIKGSRK